MRKAYLILAHLISLGVVLQAAFIAAAWFGVLKSADDGSVFRGEDNYNLGHTLHSVGGTVVPLLGLALLVVALFAKIPGGVKWAGYTFLALVVQVALAVIAFAVPAIGALHGINAFVIIGLAEASARKAAGAEVATPAGAPAGASV